MVYWEILMLSGEEGNREGDNWMASMDMSLNKLCEIVKRTGSPGVLDHGIKRTVTTEELNNQIYEEESL